MRHRKAGKQLSRNTSHRRALLRNMTTSLLKHEQIETTDAKAKSIRPIVEKMITLAKRGDLHARRQALAYLQDKVVAHKLFEELKDRYLERQGGYVRIVKKGVRKGDGAPVSIMQLLPKEDEVKADKKKSKKASAPKKQKKVIAKADASINEAPEKAEEINEAQIEDSAKTTEKASEDKE